MSTWHKDALFDNLTCYLPGLLSHHHQDPRFPALETILARADEIDYWPAVVDPETPCVATRIFSLFNYTFSAERLPAASVTNLVDLKGSCHSDHEGHYLRTDPVYLHPEFYALILFSGAVLKVSNQEAAALITAINTELSDELGALGAHLVKGPAPERWYVRLDSPLAISSPASTALHGHAITPEQLSGNDAAKLQTLINAIQMVLHHSPINAARVARGAVPINSVWMWGGGELTPRRSCPWTHVSSVDPIAMGLAIAHNIALTSNTLDSGEWPDQQLDQQSLGSHHLFVDTHLVTEHEPGNATALTARIAHWEAALFKPALKLLKARRLRRMRILCDEQCFVITPLMAHRIWRGSQPLSSYC